MLYTILSTINVQNTKCKHVSSMNKITHIFLHYTWYISYYSNTLACHHTISLLILFSCGIITYNGHVRVRETDILGCKKYVEICIGCKVS